MTPETAIKEVLKLRENEIEIYYYKKYIKTYKKLKRVEKINLELRKTIEEYKWKEFYKELNEEYIL